MTIQELVASLSAPPLRAYDDLAARSPLAPPKTPGMYAWWQAPGSLPAVVGTPHAQLDRELIYVGVAPKDAASAGDLRKRLSNHHRSAIGSSTFRFDLAALLWRREGWTPSWPVDRVVLLPENLLALAEWQRAHLSVQWVEAPEPWAAEQAVIAAMRPPLNREHNKQHASYPVVGMARAELRRAARGAGP